MKLPPRDRISVVLGDITRLDVDAVVNAANAELRPGGGVCGAIHRVAGPELAEECALIGGCPTGEARLTEGYDLPASFIIHTVGPFWRGGDNDEDRLLASCYRHALECARDHDLESVAFPAISTGIYGFPPDRAAPIAVATVAAVLEEEPELSVIFCCFNEDSAMLHLKALQAL